MSILSRYLARTWASVFFAAVLATSSVYVVIDVFDRLGEVLPFSPAWTAVASYFLFKLPKIVFDIFPAACLLATLVSIGLLSRDREVVAMHACGISGRRIALPVVACALLLSVAALAWNEAVVPVSAARSRWLWDVELKQKVYRGVFDAASLWFQNERGFVHIRRYDAGARVISGFTLYEVDQSFALQRVHEVDELRWQDDRWVASAGMLKDLSAGNVTVRPLAAGEFVMQEDPENLATRRRRAEEYSFRELRRQIRTLQARGLDADQYSVDLHHKLAWPFAGFFVSLLGVPLALQTGRGRGSGLARGTAIGLVVGFAYWVTTGLALSAGRTGGLSPVAAAWSANAACAALAALLYRRRGNR